MSTPTISCPSCHIAIDACAFLAACSSFWADVDIVQFTCPACHARTEARLEHAQISLGYVYAAGSAHFCGMVELPIDGLRVWRDGADLAVELGGATWKVLAKAAV